MKKLLLMCLCLLVLGCTSIKPKKALTVDQVIMSASDYSKKNKLSPRLTDMHWIGLKNIFTEIEGKFDPLKMKFASIRTLPAGNKTGGIMFGRRIVLDKSLKKMAVAKNEKWLALSFVYGAGFNSVGTNFDARAATIFGRYGTDIVNIVNKQKELLNDNRVQGVMMLFKWTVDEDTTEAIIVTSPKALYEKLENHNISTQTFLDASTVLGWQKKAFTGKMNIDLKKAL